MRLQTTVTRPRVLLIGAVVVMVVSVVACSEPPYPGSERWANGKPVHPRMIMPAGPSITLAQLQCAAGLTEQAYGFVESWVQDPLWQHIDEWTWWYYDAAGGSIPTTSDCIDSWNERHDWFQMSYWCGNGEKPYYYNKNLDYIAFFTQYFLCDANGFAYWVCPGGCIGIFGATVESTEPPLPPGHPTSSMNDPTNPDPPVPVVCTPDPRDTRMCLEMEPQ
jgi:hypothetical protein